MFHRSIAQKKHYSVYLYSLILLNGRQPFSLVKFLDISFFLNFWKKEQHKINNWTKNKTKKKGCILVLGLWRPSICWGCLIIFSFQGVSFNECMWLCLNIIIFQINISGYWWQAHGPALIVKFFFSFSFFQIFQHL